MTNRINGLTLDEMQEKERELIAKRFDKISETSKLSNNKYKVTSYSGDARSFGDDKKYNIEWHE